MDLHYIVGRNIIYLKYNFIICLGSATRTSSCPGQQRAKQSGWARGRVLSFVQYDASPSLNHGLNVCGNSMGAKIGKYLSKDRPC